MPAAGYLASPRYSPTIGFQQLFRIFAGHDLVVREHLVHYPVDVGEAYPSIEKCPNGNLVGGAKHRGIGAATLRRRNGETEARITFRLHGLKGERV